MVSQFFEFNMRFFQRFIFILLLSAYAFSDIYGQNQYSKGYIITQAGDSIKGMLKLASTSAMYKKCILKNAEGSFVEYSSKEIREFGIYNYAQFRTLKVGDGLPEFYEVLIQGKVTLYQRRSIFLIEKDKVIYDITPKQSSANPNGTINPKGYKYLGMLKSAFFDCEEVVQKLNKNIKGKKSFISTVKEYNKCSDNIGYTSFSDSSKWINVHFGPQVTFLNSDIKFKSPGGPGHYLGTLNYANFNSSKNIGLGASFVISSPKVSSNFFAEFWPYFSQSEHFSSVINNPDGLDIYSDVDIKYSYINFPLGLNYVIPSNNLRIGFKAGFNYSLILDAKMSILEEEVWPGDVIYASYSTDHKLAKNNIGYYGGITIGYNKGILSGFNLDLIYNSTSGRLVRDQTSVTNTKMNTTNFIFSLKYLFLL